MDTLRKPRATAIYARISDDTEGRAAGVQRQIEDALKLVERTGWGLSPYEPFVDNDISASTRSSARRPAFERMMELVESGQIDAIVFYSNSRLTRRPREFEDIIELVERTGLLLNSVVSGQADLSTADGRQIARMLAAADAAEAERTSERVTRAFVQRRAEGRPNPSGRAFGFEAGGEVVNEAEAEEIRQAARKVIDEGWSLGMLVKDWNARGVKTVKGAQGWSRVTLSRALLRPRAAGLIEQRGEIVGTIGSFDPIITVEEQRKMRELFAGRRNGSTVTYKERRNVLAGFLVCGKCGRPMRVNMLLDAEGKTRKDAYVVCSRSQFGCGNVKRNLLHLEAYVDLIVRERISMATPESEGLVDDAQLEHASELQARLREIEEDLNDLRETFNSGGIRFKDYNASLGALRNLYEVTEKALADMELDAKIDPDLDLLATWEDGSVEERRQVLEWAVDHIKIHPIGRVGPFKAKEMVPAATEIVPRQRTAVGA